MNRKITYLVLGTVGLALLLTGCTGLWTPPGPGVKAPIPAVPGDPTVRSALDPEAFGQGFVRGEYIEGQIVVGYLEESSLQAVLSLVDGEVIDSFAIGDDLKVALVELPAGISVPEAIGIVMLAVAGKTTEEPLEGIVFVEPNYTRQLIEPSPLPEEMIKSLEPKVYDPNADLRPYQWGLDMVGAEDAWARATGAGIVVAVVDTGVDGTHPDLQGKVVAGYDPVADTVIPAGVDSDYEGHGTHVAGIIAAANDGKGIVGLAPDALIMPIPVFQPDYIGDFDAAEGIIWAVDNGARVLNHSWGGAVYSQLLKAAFDYAYHNGAISVCAAGNDGEAWIHFPSAYPGVIAVGATTPHDEKADFSQLGGWLSVSAPGVGILSCVPTWYVQDGTGDPLLYDYWSGTSMATPFVTALAAMLLELHPAATPYQVKKLIENTAADIEAPGFDIYSGYGRIDAAAAVGAPLPPDGASAYIYTPTESSMPLYGDWLPVPYVDVVLLKDGEIRYWSQTDIQGWGNFGFPLGSWWLGQGVAAFYGIEPGTYEVIVGGDDQVRFWARTANRVTATGTLTVSSGDFQELVLPINTELEVRIDWTGAGDVDNDRYRIAIDATDSTVDTTVTVTIVQNGVPEVYGPYDVPAGSFINLEAQPEWWDSLGGPWVF